LKCWKRKMYKMHNRERFCKRKMQDLFFIEIVYLMGIGLKTII